MRLLSFIFTLLMAFGSPGLAQTAVTLGVGRLFTNDYLGDGHDRWQSGSHVVSTVRGPVRWSGGDAPFGALREYRLRGAIMASNGRGPAPGDRPYVGLVSFGVHSHYGTGTTRSSFGVDLTAIGPQTGISDFQQRAHKVLGMPKVRFTGRQMGDDLFFWGRSPKRQW